MTFIRIFGVIFYPISQYLFYMNSAKKLYFARTKDTDLLSEAQAHNCKSNIETKMLG